MEGDEGSTVYIIPPWPYFSGCPLPGDCILYGHLCSWERAQKYQLYTIWVMFWASSLFQKRHFISEEISTELRIQKHPWSIIKQCSIVCCIEEMHLYQNHSEKLKIKYKPRYTRKYWAEAAMLLSVKVKFKIKMLNERKGS